MKLSITKCNGKDLPAAFGRLSVETRFCDNCLVFVITAAFGRLSVETALSMADGIGDVTAAFGRLSVETAIISRLDPACCQPPSGG